MIHVLHLFSSYLNITENWSFRLIDALPRCRVYVGTIAFLKNNFYAGKFTYINYPLDSLLQHLSTSNNGGFDLFINRILLRFISLFFFGYKRYLKVAAKKENIQIIHSHFSFVGYEYLPLSKYLKVPHIVSFYGFDYQWLPHNYPVWKRRYKKLFKQADLFICEGTSSARLLNTIGCPADKIKIVRLGVNPEKIIFNQRRKNKGELKLLQVASFNEKKGHRYTLLAFAKALKTCPDMTLTLVGKEWAKGDEKKILNLITELNLNDKINIIPGIDFEKLHEFMHDYQVFIHPSCHTARKDCEGGAPVVLLDAQATGMPVISTFHCDIPDQVLNEKTGLLANEFDVEVLAAHIASFYNADNDEYSIFSANARQHVTQQYDITKNALELEKIYSEILDKKNTL